MTDQILSVLNPIKITDAMFISSTVLENDYAAYDPAHAYVIGNRCISIATHRVYESIANSTGKDPTDPLNCIKTLPSSTTVALNGAVWLDVETTNKWKMVDGESSSQTVTTSPLTAVFRPGFFNSNYLGNVDAESVVITVHDAPGGNVIFSSTSVLEGSAPSDYYEYFFSPFKPLTDFLASGIDPYSTAEITISLIRTGGIVKCGFFSIGDLIPLGLTQYGAKAKPKTYSYINTDTFGNNLIVRRKSAKDLSATAWLFLEEANGVLEIITALLDVPCLLVIASGAEYAGLRGYGLISGDISYDHPADCLLTINQSGMI